MSSSHILRASCGDGLPVQTVTRGVPLLVALLGSAPRVRSSLTNSVGPCSHAVISGVRYWNSASTGAPKLMTRLASSRLPDLQAWSRRAASSFSLGLYHVIFLRAWAAFPMTFRGQVVLHSSRGRSPSLTFAGVDSRCRRPSAASYAAPPHADAATHRRHRFDSRAKARTRSRRDTQIRYTLAIYSRSFCVRQTASPEDSGDSGSRPKISAVNSRNPAGFSSSGRFVAN